MFSRNILTVMVIPFQAFLHSLEQEKKREKLWAVNDAVNMIVFHERNDFFSGITFNAFGYCCLSNKVFFLSLAQSGYLAKVVATSLQIFFFESETEHRLIFNGNVLTELYAINKMCHDQTKLGIRRNFSTSLWLAFYFSLSFQCRNQEGFLFCELWTMSKRSKPQIDLENQIRNMNSLDSFALTNQTKSFE